MAVAPRCPVNDVGLMGVTLAVLLRQMLMQPPGALRDYWTGKVKSAGADPDELVAEIDDLLGSTSHQPAACALRD